MLNKENSSTVLFYYLSLSSILMPVLLFRQTDTVGVSPPADRQHVSGSWSLDGDVEIVDRKSGKQQEKSVRDGLMVDTKPA